MKFIGQVLVCLVLAGASGAAAAATAVPADAAYLSFAELYRLTVSGASAVDFGTAAADASASQSASAGASAAPAEYQVRPVSTVAAGALAQATASQAASAFTVSGASLPVAPHWLLLASGLALGAWVARRRLGYSL